VRNSKPIKPAGEAYKNEKKLVFVLFFGWADRIRMNPFFDDDFDDLAGPGDLGGPGSDPVLDARPGLFL
jgi:hypothetical protein